MELSCTRRRSRIKWSLCLLISCLALGGAAYGGKRWVATEAEESFLKAVALRKEASIKEWEGEFIAGEKASTYIANRSFFLIHFEGNSILDDLDAIVVEFQHGESKRFPYARVTVRLHNEERDSDISNKSKRNSRLSSGSGTATPITDDGYFLTNAHVVDTASAPYYLWGPTETGMRMTEARVVWRGRHGNNDLPDLALLHAETGTIDNFPFERSELPDAGTPVIVGGYGGSVPNQAGGVMQLHGHWQSWDANSRWRAFLHSAPLHPGDSGGPVAGHNGELIGINAEVHGSRSWPKNKLEDYRARALQPDRDWILQLIAADRTERRAAGVAQFSK